LFRKVFGIAFQYALPQQEHQQQRQV